MFSKVLLALLLCLLLATQVHAFGAGNIPSVATVEGKNWRHGDIEDIIKKVTCIHGHKWNSLMVNRVYFGNWLRDYSQGIDTGALSKVQAGTVRLCIMILGMMTFGYATGEFEVTSERLGTYRPEEHIDNPKGYPDDAQNYDSRLRPPVRSVELEIDPETGMKNYISNERGDWATSIGYVKSSLTRCIEHGRRYISQGGKHGGNDEDLAEALRLLGQSLHTLEDFSAHSNYIELALREMRYVHVFPHVGEDTQLRIHGRTVFPLVTGSFGMIDFIHSVLGEATDHAFQSETEEVDPGEIDKLSSILQSASGGGQQNRLNKFTNIVENTPLAMVAGDLANEARRLSQSSEERETYNQQQGTAYGAGHHVQRAHHHQSYNYERANWENTESQESGGPCEPSNFNLQETIDKIMPILRFRDKVMRKIDKFVEKIGLESLVEKISEHLQMLIFSLLAPFMIPIIGIATKGLKQGSGGVLKKNEESQFEPWNDPSCTDPTHSLLSKDHFSNILNEPAGQVAAEVLKYAVPRVLHAWENPDVDVESVIADCTHGFHHPAFRNHHSELHMRMFSVVERWAGAKEHGYIDDVLSSESVKANRNHKTAASNQPSHSHGQGQQHQAYYQEQHQYQAHYGGHGGGHEHSESSYHQEESGHSHGTAGQLLGALGGILEGSSRGGRPSDREGHGEGGGAQALLGALGNMALGNRRH